MSITETTNKELTAEMARKMVAENQKRNQIVEKLIENTNKSIIYACKNGERRCILQNREKWYDDTYTEVNEHFLNLGYEINRYSDGSGYYLTW